MLGPQDRRTDPKMRADCGAKFAELVETMHRLRAPGGCPWDAEQTHASLKPYVVEEAHELCDAIDLGDDRALRDELGDVLLQVVFHAELAAERGAFAMGDVVDAIREKLVRRHPHVFGDVEATSSAEVLANWAKIKRGERTRPDEAGGPGPASKALLAGIPRGMPALLRAHRLGERAGAAGFDWRDASGARAKVHEEVGELEEAERSNDPTRIEEEIGDLLFAVASYARLRGANAEMLLQAALDRFQARFAHMEEDFNRRGMPIEDAAPDALDAAWRRAKASRP